MNTYPPAGGPGPLGDGLKLHQAAAAVGDDCREFPGAASPNSPFPEEVK
jgi:hypothetical protein